MLTQAPVSARFEACVENFVAPETSFISPPNLQDDHRSPTESSGAQSAAAGN
jgi:hypothetical protein